MIAAESDFDVVSVYCLVESTLVSQISLVSLISLVSQISQISLVSLVREGPLKFPRCKKPPRRGRFSRLLRQIEVGGSNGNIGSRSR